MFSLLPIAILAGGGFLLFGRKKKPSTSATVKTVSVGAMNPDNFAWRVIQQGGQFFAQWRYPVKPGFAPQWIDVPEGRTALEADAIRFAEAQIILAQNGTDVVDGGTLDTAQGPFEWRVLRIPQGLYQGQVNMPEQGWVRVADAASPYYARLLVFEALAGLESLAGGQ